MKMWKTCIQVKLFLAMYHLIVHGVQAILNRLKSLPKDILDLPKLKVLADDKRNANQKYKFGFNKEENSVGKGENDGYQIESTCIWKKKCNSKKQICF